ncbi:MAG: LysR substrate-binding domain-containing protein [Pseudomonadota bacterium]
MTLDPKSLELFVRIATIGAIGKAGTELGFSRTAATERLQELETTVGTQLLHRTTRTVSLTADGEAFLIHARRILSDIDEALSELQDQTPRLSGQLRIASSASFGRKFLVPIVAKFMELYPKLSVQLHLSDTPFDIVKNGYDLSIRLGSPGSSNLKSRHIGESQRIFAAAPSYLEKHGAPTELDELRKHNCIIRSDIRTWQTRRPNGKNEDFRVSGNFDTNLAEAVTEALLAGVGIARKCKWEVAEYLETGELVRVLDDHTVMPQWGIFAVRPGLRKPPARVSSFIDFIEQEFKKIPALTKTISC